MADAERDPRRFNVVPTPETHFSWLRTRMSVERTLMSAVRTATSLIAFGFTLFQFLKQFNRMPGVVPPRHQDVPWYLGLTLIGAGVLGLLIGLYEYRKMLGYLWSEEFRPIAGIERTHGTLRPSSCPSSWFWSASSPSGRSGRGSDR